MKFPKNDENTTFFNVLCFSTSEMVSYWFVGLPESVFMIIP